MTERQPEVAAETDATAATSAASSETASKPAPAKRQPLLTLRDFYSAKRAAPTRFLSDLRKNDVWDFAPDDVASALRLLDEADPKFARSVALAAAAVSERDGRFARAILAFVQQGVQARLATSRSPGGRAPELAQSNGEGFRSFVGSQSRSLATASKRTEALNLILASALHMVYSGQLPVEVVIVELAKALDERSKRNARAELSRVARLAAAGKSGQSELRLQLQLVLPWIEDAARARDRAEEAESQAEEIEASLKATRSDLEVTTQHLTETTYDLEQARAEIEALNAKLVAAQHHNAHDLREMRGRVAGALAGRLVELVATIRDALEIDPPRLAVAREKAEIAQEELEKQLEWLRSSA